MTSPTTLVSKGRHCHWDYARISVPISSDIGTLVPRLLSHIFNHLIFIAIIIGDVPNSLFHFYMAREWITFFIFNRWM